MCIEGKKMFVNDDVCVYVCEKNSQKIFLSKLFNQKRILNDDDDDVVI